jgi:hypothetical protein
VIERDKGCCSVAAAPSHARGYRDVLGHLDGDPSPDTGSVKKGRSCSPHEIVLIHGNRQTLPGKLNFCRDHPELQDVADVDRDHEGYQFMVSIRPTAGDLESEVLLGGSLGLENPIFQWKPFPESK